VWGESAEGGRSDARPVALLVLARMAFDEANDRAGCVDIAVAAGGGPPRLDVSGHSRICLGAARPEPAARGWAANPSGSRSSPVPSLGEHQPDILETVIVSPGFRVNRSKSYSLPPWRRGELSLVHPGYVLFSRGMVWSHELPSGIHGSTCNEVGQVLLRKDDRRKLSAAPHIDLLKDRFEVILHCVR
jgi:hypothetical protein